MKLFGGLLFLFLLLGACKGGQQPAEDPLLTLLLTDAYGGTVAREAQLIREEAGLRKVFARINRSRKPGIPVPEINFQEHMALVWCSGQQADTIVPLLRTKAQEQHAIILEASVPETARDTSLKAITLPLALYLLPRSERPVHIQLPGGKELHLH